MKKINTLQIYKTKDFWVIVVITIVFWQIVISLTQGAVLAGLSLVVGWLLGSIIVKVLKYLKRKGKK